MSVQDLRCSDGDFAAELGRVFVGRWHRDENGNVAVDGSRVGPWTVVGVERLCMAIRGSAKRTQPCVPTL